MTDHSKTAPSKSLYFIVYFIILGLIFAAVGVSYANVGSARVYLNLLIAAAQACLLAFFFMHLKGADQLTWLNAGAGLFWLLILFLFLLTDYVTRHIAAY